MTTLRIVASRHSTFYSPLIATVAAGFLEREGLEGSYLGVPAHGNVIRSLAANEAHVAQSAVSASWPLLEQGVRPPAVHFAQINQRDGFVIAARRTEGPFSWSDLLSGELMYVHGVQPRAMLRYALFKQGLDLSALRAIDAGATEAMMAAFRRGQGDFFHEQGPYPQQLEHEGIARCVASVGEAVGPVAFSSLAARPEWLGSREAQRFMRAYRKSREWVNRAPAREVAERLLPLFSGIALPALVGSIEHYQRLGCWEGDAAIDPAHYESALDVFTHAKAITRRHPYEAVVVAPPDA
jgi:NitT/TauT family transport system substrate-binding protein